MSDDADKDGRQPPGDGEVLLEVKRPALTLPNMREYCLYSTKEDVATSTRLRRKMASSASCSGDRVRRLVERRVPIVGWLPQYQLKQNILGDAVAGITVAILHIPQGMAFALLANIPVISGIYMAFFPVIAYAILASSRHNSMGAFAVITLMTGKVVNEHATFPNNSDSSSTAVINATLITGDPVYTPVEVATIVCFMAGFWSVLLGFFSFGSLTVFFNDMLVSAFSTGAAFHVVTSQVKDLLGITVQSFSGPFKIIYTYIDIFHQLPTANLATVIVSAVSIIVLALNNELLKPRLAKITRIPMPIELIVVVIGTLTSFLVNFPAAYGVTIVGEIPTGLPPPTSPPFSLAGAVAVDSLVIAIIAYAGSFSLAKIFAIKRDYDVDANQELYAMGFGNMVSSFFSCAPMAAAISRVLIQDSVGGVTQVACLITAFAILWVLLFIGPLFEFLPKACLASIIVVALKGMFMEVFDVIKMWKISKMDAMLWVITLTAVIVIDVDLGLLVGVLVAVGVLIVKGQNPTITRLGNIPDTDLYLDMKRYSQAAELPGLLLVSVQGPLHFANRDNFRTSLVKVSALDPVALRRERAKEKDEGQEKWKDGEEEEVVHLVIDMQGVPSCDVSAGRFITRMTRVYESVGVVLCLAGLNDSVAGCLSVSGTMGAVGHDRVFHTVHDAVTLVHARPRVSATTATTAV